MDARLPLTRVFALMPAAIVTLVFGGVLANGWVNWDDPLHVLDNPRLTRLDWQGVVDLWRAPYRGLYVPVSYSMFAIEAALGRAVSGTTTPAAIGFHALSVLLHGGCAALVVRLLRRLGASSWAAVGGAAVFAVHPLQVESVAWISEQRGLLAGLFGLAAVDLLGRRDAPEAAWGTRASAATACFVTALLCKPTAVVVPLLAVVMEWNVGPAARWPARRFAPLIAVWLLLAAGIAGVTSRLQPVDPAVAGPLLLRPLVAGNAVAFYAVKTVAPMGMCIDYGLTPLRLLADPWTLLKALTVAGVIGAVFVVPRLRPARLPVLLFVVPLLPVLGFVPFAFEAISTVADRYAYLAMLGPAAAVAAVCDTWRSRWVGVVVTAILVMLAAASIRQVPVWRDSLALNAHALAINGGTRDTLNNLGLGLLDRGRLDDAADCFERAISHDAGYPRAHFNLGLARHRSGRLADAEREYREALRLDAGYAVAHNNLGILLGQTGRITDAATEFRAALALDPALADAKKNLFLLESLDSTGRGE
jgi:protein O-mannosyl-transferase